MRSGKVWFKQPNWPNQAPKNLLRQDTWKLGRCASREPIYDDGPKLGNQNLKQTGVPCTCEAIAKKHKERMARHQAIVDQMNAIYAEIRKPIYDARKLMETQLLVARAARMRIKEARRMRSKEKSYAG